MKIKNKSIHKKCLLSSFLPPFSQPQRQLYQTGCGHSPSAVAGHTAGRHGAFFLPNFKINERNTSQFFLKKEKGVIKIYLHTHTHTHTLLTVFQVSAFLPGTTLFLLLDLPPPGGGGKYQNFTGTVSLIWPCWLSWRMEQWWLWRGRSWHQRWWTGWRWWTG